MKNNTTLLAFGTFGSPNGFTQTAFYGNKNINLKEFDLNTNAIKLFPNTNLTAVRKEAKGLSYVFYSFAREKGSTRGGTFIGSALYYEESKAKESLSIEVLKEFHKNLIQNNVVNGEISVLHSSNLKINQPQDFDKLYINAGEEILTSPETKKNLVIYDENGTNKLSEYITKAPLLFLKYDAIYFTADKKIADYVNERELFKLMDSYSFEQEITSFEEEKVKKIQETLSELEKEIQTLKEKKDNTIKNLQKSITSQEEQHKKNEEKIKKSKGDIGKVEEICDNAIKEIRKLINELDSTKKWNTITKKKFTIIQNLENEIQGIKRQTPKIENFPEQRFSTEHPSSPMNTQYDIHNNRNICNHQKERRELKKMFIITCFTTILSIVLIALLGWREYSNNSKIEKLEKERISSSSTADSSNDSSNNSSSYENETNDIQTEYDFLNENDLKLVNKNLSLNNNRIKDVVELIYKKNPSDIAIPFKNKKTEYTKVLYEMNTESFEVEKGDSIIVKNLTKIPKEKK